MNNPIRFHLSRIASYFGLFLIVSTFSVAQAVPATCPRVTKPTEIPAPVSSTRTSGATVTIYDFKTLKIHAFTAPKQALRTSSYVIEGLHKLVLIEPQFMKSLSKDFRAYVDSLGKPIDRMIVSDRDPDHYFGLASGFTTVSAYALQSVIDTINKEGPKLLVERRKMFGEEMPEHQVAPTQVLKTGPATIDCITYQFDASTDDEGGQQIAVHLPEVGIVFTGDITGNHCHLIPGKANEDRLSAFAKVAKDFLLVLPSNGVPSNNKLFSENLAYLASAKKNLQEAKTADEYKTRMMKQYPDYDCDAYFYFYVPGHYQKK